MLLDHLEVRVEALVDRRAGEHRYAQAGDLKGGQDEGLNLAPRWLTADPVNGAALGWTAHRNDLVGPVLPSWAPRSRLERSLGERAGPRAEPFEQEGTEFQKGRIMG